MAPTESKCTASGKHHTLLRNLWTEFNKGQVITEEMLLDISNSIWTDDVYHRYDYKTVKGLLYGTEIETTFDIGSMDIIVEVDDNDQKEAVDAIEKHYSLIENIVLCTTVGGYNAKTNMQGLW